METQFYTCQVVKTLINATEKVDPDLEKDQECVHGRRIRRVQIVSSCKVVTGRLPWIRGKAGACGTQGTSEVPVDIWGAACFVLCVPGVIFCVHQCVPESHISKYKIHPCSHYPLICNYIGIHLPFHNKWCSDCVLMCRGSSCSGACAVLDFSIEPLPASLKFHECHLSFRS